MTRTCTIDGCAGEHLARGLCNRHYQAAVKAGTLHEHEPVRHLTGPGAMAVHVADAWGIWPHELLDVDGGHADARRHLIHRLHHDLELGASEIARTLGFRSPSSIAYHLARPEPAPPAGARPRTECSECSVPGCGRDVTDKVGLRMCSGHVMRWRRHGDVRAATPMRAIRADDAPVLDLEVHDRRGYRDGCRCETCRADAVRAVKRNRHRPQSIPVARGARAVRRLTDQGMTIPQIAKAAGVTNAALYKWVNGGVETCFRDTVEKVEAVRPGPHGSVSELRSPTCAECDRDAFAGGRWCWEHYQEQRRAGAA